MKKINLKTGDLVELRDGSICIVLTRTTVNNEFKDILLDLLKYNIVEFDELKPDLTLIYREMDDLDVMKVCSNEHVSDNFEQYSLNEIKWTWERKE